MNLNKPKIIGHQSWKKLLFVHWRMPPEQIQAALPQGLTVETFDDDAWLAVVPFSMEKVRPWWSPPIPGISWFLETNVRTYVRHDNGQTGVWFFSLDANHRLAVTVARKFWHLNYRFASLNLSQTESTINYSGRCRNTNSAYDIRCRLPDPPTLRTATENSLEHFLLERYHLFARKPNGSFLVGQVHHQPYQFHDAELTQYHQSLTDSHGFVIHRDKLPDHIAWSPGVDVRVSPLRCIS